MLRVGDRPCQLLRAVDGLELVELPGAEECCGFGGTFALKNSATSPMAMLDDKVRNVVDTGADVLCAGGQLLPHAHRRRPAPERTGRCGRSTCAEILAATVRDIPIERVSPR